MLDEFLSQLSEAGIRAQVERQQLGFDFDDFDIPWEVLAGVTTAQLAPNIQAEAKKAIRDLLWKGKETPRNFKNGTQLIIGRV